MDDFNSLKPKEVVKNLDKYIVGQFEAKKSVAIALRNRMRRQKLENNIKDEISPKNIIMIGPTGVGKTEIARRLAKLCNAPFIKVEASKFTEVGYVGRDVESMVRDLARESFNLVKIEHEQKVQDRAKINTENVLFDLLFSDKELSKGDNLDEVKYDEYKNKMRQKFDSGKFEDYEIDIKLSSGSSSISAIEILPGMNFEDMNNFMEMFGNFTKNKKQKKLKISEARKFIFKEEVDKLIDIERVSQLALERASHMGIIFIDEIDKIAGSSGSSNADISREGVQRDILPIVEGSTVNTKYGVLDTSHILFIAAGAFHISKPSDLIPELQGRFPIRVELDALKAEDFYEILTKPENALIKQYKALLKTENVKLEFTDTAIKKISKISADINSDMENIGARRLHTVMEKLLEDLSFNAPDLSGQSIKITSSYVDEKLNGILENQDLSKYIL